MARPNTTAVDESTEDTAVEAKEVTLLPAVATEGETEEAKTARQKAVRDSYAAASTRLREENLAEFNRLHKEEAAKRGYDWSPRPTQAEKDAAALKALLEKNPELAEAVKAGTL